MTYRVWASIGCLFLLLLAGCAESPSNLPYLSKRIFVEDPNDTIINLTALRTEMRDYITSLDQSLGLYFEYLPSGASIGVREEHPYVAASLLKLPVAIKVYQMKNERLLTLNDTMRIETSDIDERFGSLWRRGVGAEVTIAELLGFLVSESDNTALRMITRKLEGLRTSAIVEVFDDLDLALMVNGETIVVSAENYTSILRSLYLASSLPKEDAQALLELMTKGSFGDKLAAGVPSDVPVAHKVGVFEGDAGKDTFADCGIVYVPKRPYSLCMFFDGSEKDANIAMSHLSKMAYDFISTAEAVQH